MALPDFYHLSDADFTISGTGTVYVRSNVTCGDGELRPGAQIYGLASVLWDVSSVGYSTGAVAFNFDLINGVVSTGLIFTLKGASEDLLRILGGTVNNTYRVEYWNGTDWIQIGSDLTDDLAAGPRFDVEWIIADSGGEFKVFYNGSEVASLTGDTLLTADTQVEEIEFSGGHTSTGSRNYVAPIAVDGASLRDFATYWDVPNLAGNTNDTGGTSNQVDEVLGSVSTVDFNTYDANAEQCDYGYPALPIAVTDAHTVEGVVLAMVAKPVFDPGFDLEGYVQRAGTDYTDNVKVRPLAGAWGTYGIEFVDDPETGVAWVDKSAIEAKTFGVTALTPV